MSESKDPKKEFRNNAKLSVLAFFLTLAVVTTVISMIFGGTAKENLYSSLAVALIITWMIVLICYYIWAIQFYNVNFGLSMGAWKRLSEAEHVPLPNGQDNIPTSNPNEKESLGLPSGTIRGTIAVSLLVAGLAMIIASMGMDSTLKANEFFIDNFEFFKTAFLMMIAFYFGNKSLEFLKHRKQVIGPNNGNDASGGSTNEGGSVNQQTWQGDLGQFTPQSGSNDTNSDVQSDGSVG